MTEHVQTRTRLAPATGWVVRRWPTWLAIALVLMGGFGVPDGRDLAFVLVLSALGYLVVTVLRRRGATWPAVVTALAGVVVLRIFGIDEAPVLLAVAAAFVVWGAFTRPAGYGLQTAATIVLSLAAAAALNAEFVLGGLLVAAGLFGHAAWDAYHFRKDKVVTRSFAEWCGVVDLLLGVAVVVAVL
jgi:hypothetical protein